MDRLLYLLAVLACPLAMGVMMWLMMRGGRHNASPSPDLAPQDPTLTTGERAELDRLRAARRAHT